MWFHFESRLGSPAQIGTDLIGPPVSEVSQWLARPSGVWVGLGGSTLIRGEYRNSIKVNEAGVQPPVLNVITSCFLFSLLSGQ